MSAKTTQLLDSRKILIGLLETDKELPIEVLADLIDHVYPYFRHHADRQLTAWDAVEIILHVMKDSENKPYEELLFRRGVKYLQVLITDDDVLREARNIWVGRTVVIGYS